MLSGGVTVLGYWGWIRPISTYSPTWAEYLCWLNNNYRAMVRRGYRDEIVECGTCRGTGVYGTGECRVCHGRGQIRLQRHHPDEQVVMCKRCNGNGVVGNGLCPNCKGIGKDMI